MCDPRRSRPGVVEICPFPPKTWNRCSELASRLFPKIHLKASFFIKKLLFLKIRSFKWVDNLKTVFVRHKTDVLIHPERYGDIEHWQSGACGWPSREVCFTKLLIYNRRIGLTDWHTHSLPDWLTYQNSKVLPEVVETWHFSYL